MFQLVLLDATRWNFAR